ncbi:MAG TPA: amino acid permease [Pyrinomonadaceae bacterium]|nr:amino acid permease [Pyrinomonadaceae bacterium]
MAEPTNKTITLVRGLGVFASVSIVVGSVIGTGIFLKTRVMMCNVESPWLVIVAWAVAGFMSLAGALTYAELAAMMPRAGGEYVFIREGYGRPLAFLYGWTQFAVAYTGSQAAKGVSFAIFLNILLHNALDRNYYTLHLAGYDFPFGHLQAVALAIIILATLVNCLAVSVSGKVSVFLTGLKILIVLAIGVCAFLLAQGSFEHFSLSGAGGACEGVEATARGGLAGFGAALLGALWAYDGWSNVTIVAGEVKRPQRNLPIALIGGILIVAALYIFANLAYLYVLSPAEVANVAKASSVATEVARKFLGPAAVGVIAMAMMLSTLGSLHTGTLSGARISYAMAKDGLFFRPLARLSERTRVPVNALVLQCVLTCVLALSGSFDTLTDYVIFAAWIFYALNTASVFIFRRRMPHAERPYRTVGYPVLPVVFLLAAGYLIVNTVIATPTQALIGLGIIALGLPIYFYWARKNPVSYSEPLSGDES